MGGREWRVEGLGFSFGGLGDGEGRGGREGETGRRGEGLARGKRWRVEG